MNVLVVENNNFFRKKTSEILSRYEKIETVVQSSKHGELSRILQDARIDLMLINIEIASCCFEDFSDFKTKAPGLKLFVYTDNPKNECRQASLDAGADKFITQEEITTVVEEWNNED